MVTKIRAGIKLPPPGASDVVKRELNVQFDDRSEVSVNGARVSPGTIVLDPTDEGFIVTAKEGVAVVLSLVDIDDSGNRSLPSPDLTITFAGGGFAPPRPSAMMIDTEEEIDEEAQTPGEQVPTNPNDRGPIGSRGSDGIRGRDGSRRDRDGSTGGTGPTGTVYEHEGPSMPGAPVGQTNPPFPSTPFNPTNPPVSMSETGPVGPSMGGAPVGPVGPTHTPIPPPVPPNDPALWPAGQPFPDPTPRGPQNPGNPQQPPVDPTPRGPQQGQGHQSHPGHRHGH